MEFTTKSFTIIFMVLYISTVVTFAAEIKIQSADSSPSSGTSSVTSDSAKTVGTTTGQGKTDQSVAGSETASVAYSYGAPQQAQVVYQQQPQVVYQQQPVAVQVQGSHYNGQKYPAPSKAQQIGYQGASLFSSLFTEASLQLGAVCFLVPALFVFFFLLKANGGGGGASGGYNNYGGSSGGYGGYGGGSNYGGSGGSIKPGLSVHAKFPSFPKISFGNNNKYYRSFDMDLVTKLALLALESFE